jgi:hypothetical protein
MLLSVSKCLVCVKHSQSVEMSWEQCNTESVSRDELGAV